jgi:hypothetical protein
MAEFLTVASASIKKYYLVKLIKKGCFDNQSPAHLPYFDSLVPNKPHSLSLYKPHGTRTAGEDRAPGLPVRNSWVRQTPFFWP